MRIVAVQTFQFRCLRKVDGGTARLGAFLIGHHSGNGMTRRCAVMNGLGRFTLFWACLTPGLWHI